MIDLLEPQLMITSDWTKAEVWQAAAPQGAKALRVGGFRCMADVETMLRDIGHAAGVDDIDARVDRFAADWRAAASPGRRPRPARADLRACTGVPYSYGRDTMLYELFSAAGFDVVADHDDIRSFRVGGPDGTIARLVDARHPELIFAFKNRRTKLQHGNRATRYRHRALKDDTSSIPAPTS